MPIRIYMAPHIGAGHSNYWEANSWTDSSGPWRSPLHKYRNIAAGDKFDFTHHPARRISISAMGAVSATHDAIDADSTITPIIPARAADMPALLAIFNTPFSSYPLAWRNAARAKLEGWGVNTEWITGTHTMKDVLRHVLKLFHIVQRADGLQLSNVLAFFRQANLDATVASIPAAQRNAIGSWLTERGYDTSWIVGTTTLRQVVHSIVSDHGKIFNYAPTIRLAGEEF